ncbi:DMT family transporter [Hydrogenophaga electricum]|uniref:Transporter YetK n=1 Tax=Hydrogenophaga electricum TaxID=1230953 RepID=A0ABQ6C1X0_9BURK|nr:DMT family transporter [Hydrogenophaga electricum]GLS12715.1 putative transporter YetK [Hydrogenophaga electricum]
MSALPVVATAPRWLAYGALALSMSLVGSYVALSKPLVAIFPVFLLAWLRFGIGGLAMASWLRRPADEPPITPRVKRLLFLESFLGNFLFSICMLFGVRLTTAVAAGVVMSAIPAVVAILSALFLKERIGRRTAAAIACAAIGIALFSLQKPIHDDALAATASQFAGVSLTVWGNLLVFAAVVCEASYVVIGKRLTEGLGPKRISAIINLWGFALVTPLGLWAAFSFDFGSVSMGLWALLVFYALAASMWTVWLWMTGLKTVPASRAGVFTVMLPVSAAAVGVLFMGERLSSLQVLAFAIALLGLVLATLPARSPN